MSFRRRRKKILVGFTTFVLAVGFFGMLALPHKGALMGRDAIDASSNEDISLKGKVHDKLVDSSRKFKFKGTKLLKKDAYPEVNELVKNYYAAMISFDMDRIENLVSDISNVDQNLIRAKLQYMENIENIICYTIDGDIEGTYRAYVYYDLKIRGIDTLAPALSAMYITMGSGGNYVIYLGELDSDTQDFISKADTSQDVKLLSSLVSDRLSNVVNSDANMKTFYDMMNAAVNSSESTPTEAPDAQVADPNAQVADPNAQVQDPNAQVEDPNAQVQDPNAQVEDPNAQVQDPNAQVADPNAQVQDPNAQVADPNAQVQDPNAQVADPNAQVQDPNAQVADPNAQVQDPNAQLADPNTGAVTQ